MFSVWTADTRSVSEAEQKSAQMPPHLSDDRVKEGVGENILHVWQTVTVSHRERGGRGEKEIVREGEERERERKRGEYTSSVIRHGCPS